MKKEKEINLDGYLKNATQKNYYKNMQREINHSENVEEYSNFEIDLYNMSKLNSRAHRIGRLRESLCRLLSQQLQNLCREKLFHAPNRSRFIS